MTAEKTSRPTMRARIGSLGPASLLAALVAVDLALVAVSVVRLVLAGPSLTDPWLLETDGGWAEYFGYAQQAALVALLLLLWQVTRHLVWPAYAAVFVCALADDYLRLHERKGAWLAEKLAFPEGFAGLRADDLGEMFVWGLLGAVPVAAAFLLHRRSDPWNRRASLGMAALIAAYVFFGAVVDQAHVLFLDSWLGDVMGTVEDGGELVVLSATVVYVGGRVASARRRAQSSSADGHDAPAASLAAAAPGAPSEV
jgi:hypothetical protein